MLRKGLRMKKLYLFFLSLSFLTFGAESSNENSLPPYEFLITSSTKETVYSGEEFAIFALISKQKLHEMKNWLQSFGFLENNPIVSPCLKLNYDESSFRLKSGEKGWVCKNFDQEIAYWYWILEPISWKFTPFDFTISLGIKVPGDNVIKDPLYTPKEVSIKVLPSKKWFFSWFADHVFELATLFVSIAACIIAGVDAWLKLKSWSQHKKK